MEHFYDGQIRRYLNQLIRMMSGFTYKDGKGQVTKVPVLYGDITRQAANIIRENSENKIPNAPRMGLYVTGLELDRSRLADSSFVSKVNIRERAFDSDGNEYLNKDGKNYTVERLMPTPYNLSVNVDVWTTNTDQTLQILEQIVMLFNPSLELQTTDNYLDWTSLSVVDLEEVSWSSRTIPAGTESEIDISTLGFKTPIYVSPPAKVKRLGVITDIITRTFGSTEDLLANGIGGGTVDNPITIDTESSTGDANLRTSLVISDTGEISRVTTRKEYEYDDYMLGIRKTAYQNLELLVMENSIKIIRRGIVGGKTWPEFIQALPEKFEAGVTQIRLRRSDWNYEISGTIALNPADDTEAIVNWDEDTIPTDTVITGPSGDRSKIDYIIDPTKSNPQSLGLTSNPRILLLGDIGDEINKDGADAWKNADNTDFIAGANDIVEWDGSKWHIVFDASASDHDSSGELVYTTNLNTGVQYKFDNNEWILSFEGEYPTGTWRLYF